jgi:hydroxymethylbilane synthase
MAQLRATREDLEVVELHGNVDTRLARLAEPDRRLRAIVLARAGLQRLGREQEAGGVLDPQRFVPAPGQGVIALEGRADDDAAGAAARAVSDAPSFACLRAERALARELGASCNTPLGAAAETLAGGTMRMRAWIGLPDGSAWLSDEWHGQSTEPEELGARIAGRMLSAGARDLLRRAEEMAAVGA